MADDSKLRSARSTSSHFESPRSSGGQAAGGGDPLAELARLIGQDDLFEQMRRDAARAGQGPATSVPAAYAETRLPPSQDLDALRDLRGSYEPDSSPPMPSRTRYAEDAETDGFSTAAAAYAVRPSRSQATPLPLDEPSYYDEPTAGRTSHYVAPAMAPAADYPDPPYASYDAAPLDPAPYPEPPPYTEPLAESPAYADPAYDPAAYAYDDPAYAESEEPPRRRGGLTTVAAVLGLAAVGTVGALGYWAFSGGGSTGEPPVIAANATPSKVVPASPNRDRAGSDRGVAPARGERVVSREETPVELKDIRSAAPRMIGQGGLSGGLSAPAPALTASPAVGGPADAEAPRRVRTVAVRPDGTIVPPGAQTTQTATAPMRTASIPPTAGAPAAAGSHVVQISSQRSEEDAQASFRQLQARYPNVLGGHQPLIRRIDLGERGTFFRVQIGPFASLDQANDLCGNLKAAGGQCIVQRN